MQKLIMKRVAFYKKEYNNAKEVIECFNMAIKIDPNIATFYYNRGNTYLDIENYTNAINDYDNAIKLNSNVPIYFYNRGIAKYNINEFDEAIKDFKIALSMTKDAVFIIKLEKAIALCNEANS